VVKRCGVVCIFVTKMLVDCLPYANSIEQTGIRSKFLRQTRDPGTVNSSNQLVTSTSLACVAAKLLHDGLVFSAIVDFDVVVAIEH
jgi:hypothetical protein